MCNESWQRNINSAPAPERASGRDELSEDSSGEGSGRADQGGPLFRDLSENSEYDEAKNEQGKLYPRMAEIEEILSNYVVIEEEPSDGSSVRLGSTVTVLDEEFDETMVYKIVGSQEADPMNGGHLEDSPSARPCWARARETKWWWTPPPDASSTSC